jgi:hypothetical protein
VFELTLEMSLETVKIGNGLQKWPLFDAIKYSEVHNRERFL